MTWYPLSFIPTQYTDSSGTPYSGAVLKAYADGSSTPINMATDYTGTATADSFALNASGYPVSDGGSVIIPHVQENYKLALYPTQAAADANSGAIWEVDDNQIADASNTAFLQAFSGDGSTTEFTVSSDLGSDEKTLMVFADRLREYSTNGSFTTDSDWTKGTGWTIGSGVATATGAISTSLEQNAGITLIEGESYTITMTITRTAGTITPSIGGTDGTARSADGTYTETILAGSDQKIEFAGSGFTGTIDDVSVHRVNASHREILRNDEFTIDGTTLTLNEAPPTGTNNILVFAPSLLLGAAQAAADEAALSETNAAASAAKLQGTSTTSLTIGTGSKVFTTQSGKFFDVGTWLLVTSDADTTNYMHGQVTAYSGTSLTLNVTNIGGSGTLADWTISVAGTRGAQGATGTVSGAADVDVAANDKILLLDTSDSDALIQDEISNVVKTALLDEDDMSSDSADKAPTQQSVKAYVDRITGVIQTVEEIDTAVSSTSINNSSWATGGQDVTITASAAGNKIRVHYDFQCGLAAATMLYMSVFKDGVQMTEYIGDTRSNRTRITKAVDFDSNNRPANITGFIDDTADDTSAHTYSFRWRSFGTTTLYFNKLSTDSDTASYITAMCKVVAEEMTA